MMPRVVECKASGRIFLGPLLRLDIFWVFFFGAWRNQWAWAGETGSEVSAGVAKIDLVDVSCSSPKFASDAGKPWKLSGSEQADVVVGSLGSREWDEELRDCDRCSR